MPTATKPISREYRIYLALWRKAYLSEEPVSVKTPNFAMAVAMRQGMYRAIRPFRNGVMLDNDLLNAAEKFVIYLVRADSKDEPHFLEFRKRMTLDTLTDMWDDLGIDEEDLLLGDERKIDKALKASLNKTAPKPTKTPFYERD
mgnify:CR=1 FL=1